MKGLSNRGTIARKKAHSDEWKFIVVLGLLRQRQWSIDTIAKRARISFADVISISEAYFTEEEHDLNLCRQDQVLDNKLALAVAVAKCQGAGNC